MKRIQYLVYLWTVVITHTGFGASDAVLFLDSQEGESVEFSCHMEPGSSPPYGFCLKRSWLHHRQVFFWHQNETPYIGDVADKDRLSISGDPRGHAVNVTFSQLKAADTDRYSCEFVVARNGQEDQKIQGRTEFFLLVTSGGDECGCSSYSTLLYALSAAAGAVLLLLVGFVLMSKGKTRSGAKAQTPMPIYEEMVGVQSPCPKLASLHLEEVESAEYRNSKGSPPLETITEAPVEKSSSEPTITPEI